MAPTIQQNATQQKKKKSTELFINVYIVNKMDHLETWENERNQTQKATYR